MFPQELTPNDVFGTNTQAQDILKSIVGEKFPNIEAQDGITAQIIDKFYDYHFPYYMGAENANIRRWENAVKAWCFRNKKLEVVEAYYNENGTNSDFKEVYTGEDITTVADTQTRTTTEKYNPINTPSSKISGVTESKGTGGNLTSTYKRGTTRTYSDGRKWGDVLKDVQELTAPVYDFINGFGALLVSPYTPACDPWQYGTTAAVVSSFKAVAEDKPLLVTVENKGTPLNALYSFNFEIPQQPKPPAGYYLHFYHIRYSPDSTIYYKFFILLKSPTSAKNTTELIEALKEVIAGSSISYPAVWGIILQTSVDVKNIVSGFKVYKQGGGEYIGFDGASRGTYGGSFSIVQNAVFINSGYPPIRL